MTQGLVLPFRDDFSVNLLFGINNGENYDITATYFEKVALSTETVFELDSLLDDTLKKTGNMSIAATEIIPVTGINLSGLDELAVGASAEYVAQVMPLTATNQSITWESSDVAIMSVDDTGVVKALAAGTATLTAIAENGAETSKQVTVYTPATSCEIKETSITMMIGEFFAPSLTINGNSSHNVTWSSSNPAVASVDENGRIYALSSGIATLKAEIDGLSAEITVSVHAEQLMVSLYQSDTQGQRLKVDLTNNSCISDFEGLVYVSIYKNGQMILLRNLLANMSAGDTTTLFFPLDDFSAQDEYTATALILGTDYVPLQEKEQLKILN